MLKIYEIGGRKYQFEAGTQPVGAIEVVKRKKLTAIVEKVEVVPELEVEPVKKARKTANKRRTVKTK